MKLKKTIFLKTVLAILLIVLSVYLIINFEMIKERKRMEAIYTVRSGEDVLLFVKSFGYLCEEIESSAERIPYEFGEVYSEYNKLQMAQGFDLTRYKGEEVTIYKTQIQNSENLEYATVIVKENLIIGCSLHTDIDGGFIDVLISEKLG